MATTKRARAGAPAEDIAPQPPEPAEPAEEVTARPVLWEITTEDRRGHQRVTRVRAATRDEALAALDLDGAAGPTVVDAQEATPAP